MTYHPPHSPVLEASNELGEDPEAGENTSLLAQSRGPSYGSASAASAASGNNLPALSSASSRAAGYNLPSPAVEPPLGFGPGSSKEISELA